MIETPHVVQTAEQMAAAIHLTVPRSGIRGVMGPGLRELHSGLQAQGVAITGPWFTHHFRMDPGFFDFAICLPVAERVSPAGRVQPERVPAMRVARTVCHGNYEGLGQAWQEFDRWIADNGHTPAADLWERYLAGPESGPDPLSWRTELTRRLIG